MTKIFLSLALLVTTYCSGSAQNWLTNLDAAKTLAKETKRPIILVFQGSDWCAPCIKLDREIWQSEAFKAQAKTHYILLKADFPKRKKNALSEEQSAHNAILAETYNQQGIFPFVVILDADGQVLGQTGYQKTTPSDYIAKLDSYIQ
ncbi:MAG: thioredoxin family protein [Saprospiraceae bacterium]|nr:thioredoxin family protein [Saprospiraceae bacterium]